MAQTMEQTGKIARLKKTTTAKFVLQKKYAGRWFGEGSFDTMDDARLAFAKRYDIPGSKFADAWRIIHRIVVLEERELERFFA